MKDRYLILDTETTGLKPFQGDKIIEIGIVEILDGKITNNKIQYYLQPDKPIPKEAIKIHKITDEMLKGKPRFKDVSMEILNFINKDDYKNYIVAHNANFDMKFLHHEFENDQLIELKKIEVIDTLIIARKKFPNEKVSLDNLCAKFNLSTSEREEKGHGALLDATLLAEVFVNFMNYTNFKELCTKKEIFFGFEKREEDLQLRKINSHTESDEILHESFLKNILKIEKVW